MRGGEGRRDESPSEPEISSSRGFRVPFGSRAVAAPWRLDPRRDAGAWRSKPAAAVPDARNRLSRIRSAANGPLLVRSCAVVGTTWFLPWLSGRDKRRAFENNRTWFSLGDIG
jgi:hypothetical protein